MPDRRSYDLNYSRGRRGRPYERAKAHCFATETHCRRCGLAVDMDLPYRDPRTGKVNRMSKSFGHVDELDAGGNPYNGRLEHLHCNVVAGAIYGAAKRRVTAVDAPLAPFRGWS